MENNEHITLVTSWLGRYEKPKFYKQLKELEIAWTKDRTNRPRSIFISHEDFNLLRLTSVIYKFINDGQDLSSDRYIVAYL